MGPDFNSMHITYKVSYAISIFHIGISTEACRIGSPPGRSAIRYVVVYVYIYGDPSKLLQVACKAKVRLQI